MLLKKYSILLTLIKVGQSLCLSWFQISISFVQLIKMIYLMKINLSDVTNRKSKLEKIMMIIKVKYNLLLVLKC